MERKLNETVTRRVGYNIQREILDELKIDELAKRQHVHQSIRERIERSIRCSHSHVINYIHTIIPLLAWLPDYPIKHLASDTLTGLSVGVMHVPQGLMYAMLAAVPPVYGLYPSFYPMFMYFIFGGTRHAAAGTYSTMNMLINGATTRLAPDSDFMIMNNISNTSIIDTDARDAVRLNIVGSVTFLAGIIQVLLGMVHFAFLVTYLSEPLIAGFTTAVAIHAIVYQFKYTFGLHIKEHTGPLAIFYTLGEVLRKLRHTNIPTLVVSIISISVIEVLTALKDRFGSTLPVPVPIQFFSIIIGAIVSWRFDFKTRYDMNVVGKMSASLRFPTIPDTFWMRHVVGEAFSVAIIGYGILISLGRIFSFRFGLNINKNQELLALGLCNLFGGFFQCLAISCAISRSMVQVSIGGKTQVFSAISALVVFIFMLRVGQIFEEMPRAILSAVLYNNVGVLLKQFGQLVTLWKKDRVDLLVWVMSFILTIILNHDVGLGASILFSMATIILRTQIQTIYSVLGQIPDTNIYKPLQDYNQVVQIPGLLIFQGSSTLFYANSEMYMDKLLEKCGLDAAKLHTLKKKVEADAKRLRDAKEAEKYEVSVIMRPEHEQIPESTIPKAIILDLSPVNFLDTSSAKTLLFIHKQLEDAGIKVFLSGCRRCVIDRLAKQNFFNAKVTKAILFSSVHDAVLHWQGQNTLEVTVIRKYYGVAQFGSEGRTFLNLDYLNHR